VPVLEVELARRGVQLAVSLALAIGSRHCPPSISSS
jgi:hypothetical protein